MGFIKAFSGALGGTFADQWQDFYGPKQDIPATAGLFQAVPQGPNAGRGENTKGNNNIISNGSKIIVPEGTALITIQDGAVTGFIAEPGGFIYKSDDPNSQSMYAGDGIIGTIAKSTWEKVKFGGTPGTEQLAFYVNLKLITGNKFGTPNPIYWQDEFLATKAGGSARGTYSLQIVDPLTFFKTFVPDEYKRAGADVFDFAEMENPSVEHLFRDFVTCLTGAFKRFSLQAKENGMDTIEHIQSNVDKFAITMDEEIENTYKWSTNYGLKVISVNMLADYDVPTLEILEEARKADQEIRKAARMGTAYSNNMAGMMAAASGQAMQSAASNENGAMMGFMGMNMAQQNGANLMGAVNNMQPAQQPPVQNMDAPAQSTQVDVHSKLTEMKKLLDDGLITQADFDAVKAKLLGI